MTYPFLGSFGPAAMMGGAVTPLFSYRNTYNSTGSLTTYTFSASDLGEADSARVVVVATLCVAGSGRTVSSMTIGGVSATLAVTSGSGTNNNELWYAVVPSGETGDIAVTWSGACTACGIHVWAGYPASSTPVDALGTFNAADTTRVLTDLAKTAGGFACFATRASGSQTVILTQNGAETITENYDGALTSGTVTSGAMSFLVTATTTANDFTATFSTSAAVNLVGATWA